MNTNKPWSWAELLYKQSYCCYYSAPVLPSRALPLQSIWVFMVHDTIMIKMLASNSEEEGTEREWEVEEEEEEEEGRLQKETGNLASASLRWDKGGAAQCWPVTVLRSHLRGLSTQTLALSPCFQPHFFLTSSISIKLWGRAGNTSHFSPVGSHLGIYLLCAESNRTNCLI